MAIFIDKGMKGPDDPIFREGIGIVSIRKAVDTPTKKTPPPAQEPPPDREHSTPSSPADQDP